MTFSPMPDPDWRPPTVIPTPASLYPCVICSTMGPHRTCLAHRKVAHLFCDVRNGQRTDWEPGEKPTHDNMMTLPTRGHGVINWQAQLAVLLATLGVALGEDNSAAGWGGEWDM